MFGEASRLCHSAVADAGCVMVRKYAVKSRRAKWALHRVKHCWDCLHLLQVDIN